MTAGTGLGWPDRPDLEPLRPGWPSARRTAAGLGWPGAWRAETSSAFASAADEERELEGTRADRANGYADPGLTGYADLRPAEPQPPVNNDILLVYTRFADVDPSEAGAASEMAGRADVRLGDAADVHGAVARPGLGWPAVRLDGVRGSQKLGPGPGSNERRPESVRWG